MDTHPEYRIILNSSAHGRASVGKILSGYQMINMFQGMGCPNSPRTCPFAGSNRDGAACSTWPVHQLKGLNE